jgi:hypothetical protein
MSNLLWGGLRAEKHHRPQERGLDPYDPREPHPSGPLQMFTRLGVLLMIALGFGLAAELLARLAPQ